MSIVRQTSGFPGEDHLDGVSGLEGSMYKGQSGCDALQSDEFGGSGSRVM